MFKGLYEKLNDKTPLPKIYPKTFGLPLDPDVKVMVMISGWPDTHTAWDKQIELMKDEYHIVSITSPDHDNSALQRKWGYTLDEVPSMIGACIDNHLGEDRKIDVLVTHDWGALYGYYLLESWRERESGKGQLRHEVEKLIAIEVGASDKDDVSLPAHLPGFIHHTLHSAPYQIFLAVLFAIGNGISEKMADFIATNGWSLEPLITPMNTKFNWKKEAVRPINEVKWWYGYAYFYTWIGKLGIGPVIKRPAFPKVPTLFLYGQEKRTFFHSQEFEDRLAKTPGSRVIGYPNASHWLMFTHSPSINKDILEFLSNS